MSPVKIRKVCDSEFNNIGCAFAVPPVPVFGSTDIAGRELMTAHPVQRCLQVPGSMNGEERRYG